MVRPQRPARAKRSLGQNFLVDPSVQRRIVAALDAQQSDTVLEIGPGTGALTRHLAGSVERLLAVEKDDALAAALGDELGRMPGVEIVHADALELDLAHLLGAATSPRIIGNIPYNITTPLIFHLLDLEPRPLAIVLMIQKEVADRILAPPGGKEYGALSVGVRAVADVERLFNVGKSAFWPPPDVMSTVIRLTPHRPPRLGRREEEDLRALTRAAFSWRRKQLQKILRAAPAYALSPEAVSSLSHATGLDFEARPESLAPEEFVRLARALRALGLPALQAASAQSRDASALEQDGA
ncbi:MAG TPA: 16S rRNA (adenine(1518)-N(6)/adenine(1519)-N(6))-dimethyltransferase RsmA [Longimicrobiales bacterium]